MTVLNMLSDGLCILCNSGYIFLKKFNTIELLEILPPYRLYFYSMVFNKALYIAIRAIYHENISFLQNQI